MTKCSKYAGDLSRGINTEVEFARVYFVHVLTLRIFWIRFLGLRE